MTQDPYVSSMLKTYHHSGTPFCQSFSFTNSFFEKTGVREQLNFGTRTTAERTKPGTRQSVSLDELPFVIHVYQRHDYVCGTLVADREYPERVAFTLLNKKLRDLDTMFGAQLNEIKEDTQLDMHSFQEDLDKYQNPEQADKLMQIEKNLDEITEIMHKNIDQVLERGEKLDDLMERSDDLSAMSKQFYKTAKKNNQCCQYY